jgi:hypothetical protein
VRDKSAGLEALVAQNGLAARTVQEESWTRVKKQQHTKTTAFAPLPWRQRMRGLCRVRSAFEETLVIVMVRELRESRAYVGFRRKDKKRE